jgi:spore coat polysaccharide biosynthesis protein SpsF (cytidylyltransferase family)
MSTIVILQARMSSNRLPGKVLKIINGKPMIEHQIRRIERASKINKLIVATSTDSTDDELYIFLQSLGVEVFRGELHDVHQRFMAIALENPNYSTIVRLTGDCPFVMPDLLDEMVRDFHLNQCDYYSNIDPPTFPDGLDIEIFSREAFMRLSEMKLSKQDREHVTIRFRAEPSLFVMKNKRNLTDQSHMRWTVDYAEDFNFASAVFSYFSGRESEFDFNDILKILEARPELRNKVSGSLRNEALNGEEGGPIDQI